MWRALPTLFPALAPSRTSSFRLLARRHLHSLLPQRPTSLCQVAVPPQRKDNTQGLRRSATYVPLNICFLFHATPPARARVGNAYIESIRSLFSFGLFSIVPSVKRTWLNVAQGRRVANGISPSSVLIVNKLRTKPVIDAIDTLLVYLRKNYPGVQIFHEERSDIPNGVKVWHPGPDAEPIDLVITIGGDGTILHASSLFKVGAVPPVLSFSMGTLGFLLPFHIDDYTKAIDSAFAGRITVLHRMRLSCTFQDSGGDRINTQAEDWQVMNEIALHRGSSPHLNTIDVFVDGQHLTEAVSDGLIVSTPTGSTAYSLSAGGPIVHPSLSAIVLTPICPRSLSFRPLVFPSSSSITLRISERSRASAGLSMDGQVSHVLNPGESVSVRASLYPIPCINRSSITEPSEMREGEEGVGPGKEDDWVRDINNLLQYNATFRSKALTRHQR